MSDKHPIIAITGSSGAGTTPSRAPSSTSSGASRSTPRSSRATPSTATTAPRCATRMAEAAAAGNGAASATSAPRPTCSPSSKRCFQHYGETGTGTTPQVPPRRGGSGAATGRSPAPSRRGSTLPADTTCCSTRACTAAVTTDEVDVARHADLLIGVVPIINLEWIQKLHRDKSPRGYSTEAVIDTILRRMPDYVNYICPQFSRTAHQFPARADGGHLQPLHRARHPDAPTRACW